MLDWMLHPPKEKIYIQIIFIIIIIFMANLILFEGLSLSAAVVSSKLIHLENAYHFLHRLF